jgi:hypothetical protein
LRMRQDTKTTVRVNKRIVRFWWQNSVPELAKPDLITYHVCASCKKCFRNSKTYKISKISKIRIHACMKKYVHT